MFNQPLILSLETTTRPGGAALLSGALVLGEKMGGEKSSHSAQLLSDVGEILQKNDLTLKQIHLLAVAVGPGSFTGLRIGLSTAKALGQALKIPIAGISTLEAAAENFQKEGEFCVILPAGRNEYFAQYFHKSAESPLKSVSQIEIYSAQHLKEKATDKNKLHLISTAEVISGISGIDNVADQNLHILPANLAISVGRIAQKKYLGGKLNEYPPQPVYARGADIGGHKNAK